MADLKEIQKQLQAGACVMIDVREEDELREDGIIEGALWHPCSKMEDCDDWQSFVKQLPKDKEIYLYCKVGGRAGRVASILGSEGYRTNNLGGFKDLKAAGLPIRKFP